MPDSFENNDTLLTASPLGTLSGVPRMISNLSIDDDDWFQFSIANPGAYGNSVRIDFTHANGDIDLELLDANGNSINTSQGVTDNEEISLAGLAAGTYYARVYGFLGVTNPSYTLTITPPGIQPDAYEENDNQAAPSNLGTLATGTTVSNLSISDDDWYQFTITNSGTYNNSVFIDFLHANGDIDMELRNTNGTVISASTGVSDREEISLNGLAAGTYLLHVYGYAGATNPNYTLGIHPPGPVNDSYEDNDTQPTAANLGTLTATQTFDNLSITDNDWYRFSIANPGTYENFVRINFSHTLGDVDLQLLDANGTVLSTSSGVDDSEEVSLNGLAAGSYYIRVYGYNGAINPAYSLTIAPPRDLVSDVYEPNDSRATAVDLRNLSGSNQFNHLSIHQSGNEDWYKFVIQSRGTLDSQVSIDFNGTVGDIDLELYDQDGVQLSGSYGVGNQESVSLDGLLAGTYFVRAYGFAGATNNYNLTINAPIAIPNCIAEDPAEQNDSRAQAYNLRYQGGLYTSSNLNLTMDDSANESSRQDWFKFNLPRNGVAGNQVAIQFEHARGDLDMALFDSNGNEVGRSQGVINTEFISLDGRLAGDYYIQVYGYQNVCNPSYTLTVDALLNTIPPDRFEINNSFGTATDLRQITGSGNVWQNLNIDTIGDQDWFKFTTIAPGTANDSVQISFSHAAGDLALTLFDSNGTQLRQSNTTINSELVSLQGLAAGTYYAQVTGVNGATNSDYTVGINAPTPPGILPNWTILVYLDADNNLEDAGIGDINEMEAVVLPNGVRVATLVDRIPGYDTSNGDWTDTRRGVIVHDSSTSTISSQLTSVGELNMGDPQTLTDFIQWGIQNNPAQNYGLVIWNHGGGLPGVTWDDSNGEDNLSLKEISQAIQNSGHTFDLIGFDTCLQGMVEQGYQLRNLTDVMVASQKVEPGDGWDYTAWLTQLAANPDMSAINLGAAIVNTYGAFYGNSETLSATRVGNYAGLKNALNDFAVTALNTATDADWLAIAEARNAAPTFTYREYCDLKTFTDAIAANTTMTGAIRTSAQAVSTAVTEALIRNHSGTSEQGTGLSIYLPASGQATYSSNFTDFYADTNWLNFLNRQPPTNQARTNSADWAEVNNVRSQATNLHRLAGAGQLFTTLNIGESSDIDWFQFETVNPGTPNDSVQITFDTTSGALKLQLFDAGGTLLQTSTSITDGSKTIEQVSLAGIGAGQHFLKVYGVNGGLNTYSLTVNAPQSNGIIEDWAERNDSREQAYALGTIDLEERRFPGLTMDGTANEPLREDWFTITANRGSDLNPDQVSIEFDHSQGNLDLYLYDANGNPINPTQGVTDGTSETVSLTDVANQIYIRVAGRDNTVTNPNYTLVFRGDRTIPNRPPTVQSSTFTVAENSVAATIVGTVIANDPENSPLTYALVNGNLDLDGDTIPVFAINSSTGVITVADSGDLNVEQTPNFDLTLRVTDLAGQNASGTIVVNLSNVPEAPVAQSVSLGLVENAAAGTVVGRIPASDPDGDLLSYAIASGNPDVDGDGIAALAINSTTGDITVVDSGDLNYELQSTIGLAINVQDPGGLLSPATATINLADVPGETLAGTRGGDRLIGDAGNNVITGGFGNDVITTGNGNDRVLFDIGRPFKRNQIGVDTITDFDPRLDKIVLDKTTFKAIAGKRMSFASVKTVNQAKLSNALFTYVRRTGALYYNENKELGGFGKGGQFADLPNGVALTVKNFVIQA